MRLILISTIYTLTISLFSSQALVVEDLPIGIQTRIGNSETCHDEYKVRAYDNFPSTFESILADDIDLLDSTLSSTIHEIKLRGAHRCWHKHSTFLEHLLGVHNILRLWDQSHLVSRVGLLHSAYSNSYVNLALFDPKVDSDRQKMQQLVGIDTENIIHLFCIIDRQQVVVHTLLKQGFIPQNGLNVTHIRDKEQTIYLSPEILQLLIVFTMADVADQYFEWQDILFGGSERRNSMLQAGEDDTKQHDSTALWPGLSRPGLWMHYVSELGAVARTYHPSTESEDHRQVNRIEVKIPPVFDFCTKVLSKEDEDHSRSLYWSVVSESISRDQMERCLNECIRLNPWIFEPHVMLAQIYLHRNDHIAAEREAKRALELQQIWGTAWDKRLGFAAWVAWTRVLLQRATDRIAWPSNSWEVNNFGLVR